MGSTLRERELARAEISVTAPEGLEGGFTHCFLITFKIDKDRKVFLPHPVVDLAHFPNVKGI